MALRGAANSITDSLLARGNHAFTQDQQQASRVLAAAGQLLLRGLTPQQHPCAHPWPSLPHVLALETEKRDQDETDRSLPHLHLQHALPPSFMYRSYQQALPLALRHIHSIPVDISGRRHISFFRFLSGGASPKRRGVPDAADADAALADYQELRARLDKVQRPASIRTAAQVLKETTIAVGRGLLAVWQFLLSVPRRINDWRSMTPEDWAKWKKETWATVKHEAHHYWVGTKLLGYEVRIASSYALKAAKGKSLTRRERTQLTRTTADLFRLVPMIIIVVIPLLEFTLPLLLRIFPNMLPSTFEDKLKKEEELKRRLVVRLELARFLQDTVAEMAVDIARRKGGSGDAQELNAFIEKVRAGKEVDNSEIIKFARLFNDELTLDHLERVQLVSMCHFVGISPFGTDAFLRSRLRQHLLEIKQDDYEIEQEGLENMTEEELRTACRARGMRAPFGEGAVKYMERQMRDWLDLSLHRGLPSSLLLLSRAFTITAGGTKKDISAAKAEKYEKLKETLGVIPELVVDSVAVEQLGSRHGGVEALQQRLEFLQREEEAIRTELQRAEIATQAAQAQEAAMRSAVTAGDLPLPAPTAPSQAASTSTPLVAAGPDVTSTLVAPEEAAATAQAAKDKKIKAIIGSLMEMATQSAVAKERSLFMGLMRKEIERVNSVLAESGGKGSSTGTMTFSSKGLIVAKDKVLEEDQGQQDTQQAAKTLPSRLGDRVSRMLTSIEAELDAVENKIGKRLHVLDVDADGKISPDEVDQALKFLRDQLSPVELSELLLQLKQKAKEASAEFGAESLELAKLVTLADDQVAAAMPELGQQQQQQQAAPTSTPK